MSASITTICALKTPLLIDNPDCDLIISGMIRTDCPITLRVRNLIIIGEVITSSILTIHASQEFLNFGNVCVKGAKAFVNVLDARVIEKLAGLSIIVLQDDPLKLSYQPTKDLVLSD